MYICICLAVTRVCSQTAPEQVKKCESRAMDEIRSGTPEWSGREVFLSNSLRNGFDFNDEFGLSGLTLLSPVMRRAILSEGTSFCIHLSNRSLLK